MTDPAREPLLFIRIEADIKTAGELRRRGQVREAVEFVALVEEYAQELKLLLADRGKA